MPRLRYCWSSEKWIFNFTRIFRYWYAQIAILLTVAKSGMLFYGGNLISTCLDRDTVDRQTNETSTLRGYFDINMHRLRYCWPLVNSECHFMRAIWHRHASIAILLAVRKVKVQFYVGNLMSACAKWRSVVQRCTFTDACNHMIYAKLMECCSKLDFPWKRLAAQSSEKWWSVVQNHTSAACCEKHNSANLMDCCSKVDFPW